jgi:hypothetical protein
VAIIREKDVENKDKTILDYALEYHKRGWCVIPIKPGSKKPALRSWILYQTKQPTEKQLRKWFDGNHKNMAVVCGQVSGGLACRDFDDMAAYEKWTAEHPEYAKILPTVKTVRGMHVYFQGHVNGIKHLANGELRGSGSYCLLPPSLHPDRITYEWHIPPNGQIPMVDPHSAGLAEFTEETEEIEDIEDIDRNTSNEGKKITLENLSLPTRKRVEDAIAKTLPKAEGKRNWMVFQLCRWLKGIPELANLTAKQLKPIVKEWHKKALPVITTKPFDVTWADFTYGWPRVKYPKGDGILRKATQKALEAKDILPEAEQYELSEVRFLVRVCYELQQLTAPKPFWLSCHSAVGILGVSHTQANKWLQMLVADDILKVEKQHTTKTATRYRYIAGK